MKTLLAYGSKHVAARLVDRLGPLSGVEIIGQAYDAAGALAQIVSRGPELVIMDLFLPGGSGLLVLKHVKNNPPGPAVMMTTGSMFPQDRRQCLINGADYFFHLPDEVGRLIRAVAELARNFPVEGANAGRGKLHDEGRGRNAVV